MAKLGIAEWDGELDWGVVKKYRVSSKGLRVSVKMYWRCGANSRSSLCFWTSWVPSSGGNEDAVLVSTS